MAGGANVVQVYRIVIKSSAQAIWDAITGGDDWSAFNAKVAAIRTMGEALR